MNRFLFFKENLNTQELTDRRKGSTTTTTKNSVIANKILKEDEMSSEDLLDLIMKCQVRPMLKRLAMLLFHVPFNILEYTFGGSKK